MQKTTSPVLRDLKTAGESFLSLAAFVVLLCVSTSHAFSQDPNKDYDAGRWLITINKMSPEAVQFINSVVDKRDKIVSIGRRANQSDFSEVCTQFHWIRKLAIHQSDHIHNLATLSHLDSLEEFTGQSLKKSREEPIDLQPLATIKSLLKVDFNSTWVKNTDALGHLQRLERIGLRMSNVNSIEFLRKTPKVQDLSLNGSGHTFADYTPLSNLKELRILDISNNNQATDENLKALLRLTNLEEIIIAYNKEITSLGFLEGNQNMQVIVASNCTFLRDFSALSEFKNLRVLGLKSTKLEDLNLLQGITSLEALNCTYTNLKDLSFLSNSQNLHTIKVSHTGVEDLSPLANCRNLLTVEVSRNSIYMSQRLDELKKNNPRLNSKIVQ